MTATGNDDGRGRSPGDTEHTGYSEHAEHAEPAADAREELARLLPAPAERDLPSGSRLRHKELLMEFIDNDTNGTQHPRREDGAHAASRFERFRRRLPRPALLVPATALALAGAVTATLAVLHDGGSLGGDDESPRAQQGVAQLDRISNAALESDTEPVRDSQYVYVHSKVREGDLSSGKVKTGPLEDREVWHAQRQAPIKTTGFIHQDDRTIPINSMDSDGTPAGIHRPTYRWLASLPNDPDKLLRFLYDKTPGSDDQERHQAVFDQIGELIGEQTMPPETAAALYKATAKIPGVTEAPDAVDAIGRKGVGIAREDGSHPQRSEWVFDPEDLTYLGSRTYLTEDSEQGPANALLSSQAVLKRGVVDKGGKRPTPEQVEASTVNSEQTRKG